MAEEDKKGFDWALIRRLLGFLKPHRLWVTLALVGLALASLGDLAVPLLLQDTIDKVILGGAAGGGAAELGRRAWLFLGLLLGTMGSSFVQVYVLTLVSQKVLTDLRRRLFDHLLGQSQAFFHTRPVGTLVNSVTNDVQAVSEFFNTLFSSLLRDLALMAGVLIMLFSLHPGLAGIVTLSLPPVILLTVWYRRRSRQAYRAVRSEVSTVSGFLNEHLSGMSLVQLFGRQSATGHRFAGHNQDLLKANLGEMVVNATFRPLIDVLASVSLGLLLFVGANWVLAGAVSLGILIAFVQLVNRFYSPVANLSEYFSVFQSAFAGGERVFALLDHQEAVQDLGSAPWPETWQRLKLADLHFAYQPDDPVLRGLNLSLERGQTLALVGPTGAGKSTVANLLTRFYEPQGGHLVLEGGQTSPDRPSPGDAATPAATPLAALPLGTLRRRIQAVWQDVTLFRGTLRENITLDRPLDEAQLETICRRVRLHDFIRGLPEGYDTVLTDNGQNLSAGQRQLLSFARVLAQDPEILILDEATAQVDSETEHLLQEALAEVLKDRTSLVIAHRLSTIRHADQIAVIDGGHIVEQGRHEALMAADGLYATLVRLGQAQGLV